MLPWSIFCSTVLLDSGNWKWGDYNLQLKNKYWMKVSQRPEYTRNGRIGNTRGVPKTGIAGMGTARVWDIGTHNTPRTRTAVLRVFYRLNA